MEEKEAKISTKNEKDTQSSSGSQKAANGIQGGLICGIYLSLVAWLVYSKIFDFAIGQILVYAIGLCAFVCYMVALSCFFDWKKAKRIESLEEEARKEEKEFSEIDPSKRALRSEKLFRMNQKEL